ncbi:hypothetical protein SVAN01_03179 [Stagonosporopsis vannaccii]|nr:hypothetical protein SVAN01_03179 [Stagonosporopsis vannaccii]
MSDVIQNQGPAADAPLSQPCRCTPRTARGWPVHLPSPSRNGGAIGKTVDGSDVMPRWPRSLPGCAARTLRRGVQNALPRRLSNAATDDGLDDRDLLCDRPSLPGACPLSEPHRSFVYRTISICRPFAPRRVRFQGIMARNTPRRALPCLTEASDVRFGHGPAAHQGMMSQDPPYHAARNMSLAAALHAHWLPAACPPS